MIQVSRQHYWHDLDALDIPHELRILLRGIIGNHLSGSIMPTANVQEIKLAKAHLADGIQIGDQPFTILIFIPDNPETHRTIFTLVPSYPKGTLKRLDEF